MTTPLTELWFAAPDEATFITDLDRFCDEAGFPRLPLTDEAGTRRLPSHCTTGTTRIDFDVTENLVGQPGTYDADGNQITAPVMRGWHVNVTLSEAHGNDTTKHTGRYLAVAQAISAWFASTSLEDWDTPASMRAAFGISQARKVRRTPKSSVRFEAAPAFPKRVRYQ